MKLLILDRDGVINYDSTDYIKSVDEWRPIPGSLEAIARLNQNGYTVAVATNQSGIARQLYTHETLANIHQKMLTLLNDKGGDIHHIEYCPHHPDEGCVCRKPNPAMLHTIADKFKVDIDTVSFVGDRMSDMDCAMNAGAKPILIQSPMTYKSIDKHYQNIPHFASLNEAVTEHFLA